MVADSRSKITKNGLLHALANLLRNEHSDGTARSLSVALASAVPAGTNNIGDVDVLSLPKSSAANVPAILTAAGDVIAANAGRKQWAITNLGTNPLFVRLGTGASATEFHFCLKGAAAADDGSGGVVVDDMWTGVVSCAGTSPRFAVTELT
jgi:hypothetical protein